MKKYILPYIYIIAFKKATPNLKILKKNRKTANFISKNQKWRARYWEENGEKTRKREFAFGKLNFSKKVVDKGFPLWYDSRAEKNFMEVFSYVYVYGKTC